MSELRSGSHCVYCLQYHLILVCKYRKKLLVNQNMINSIWKFSVEYFHKHNIKFHAIGDDKDHIHYMIELTPVMNLSNEIRGLKVYTAYHMWQLYETYLSTQFWNERTFWSDSYYVASIGNVSEGVVLEYVRSQGM